jgi:hypothetical protein
MAQGVAAALAGLGLIFLTRPETAARIFGLPVSRHETGYVRALGVRDVALSVGLLLSAGGSPRTLAATTGTAGLIPLGDLILVSARKPRPWLSMLLHGASFAALVSLAIAARPFRAPVRTRAGRAR